MIWVAVPLVTCLLAGEAYEITEEPLGRFGDPVDLCVTSDDAQHIAYVTYSESDDVPARFGMVDMLWAVWLDGRRVATHHREDHTVRSLSITPRYGEPCYVLRYHASRSRVVLNGHESRDYEAIGDGHPLLAPDGEACAYAAMRDGAWRVVVQARRGLPREEPPVDEIRPESLRVGPGGGAVAYVAKRDGEWRAILNGVAGPGFNEIRADSLVLSATGERWAYAARRDTRWMMVIDGVAGAEYDWVSAPVMDAHGTHVGYSAMLDGEGLLVRDAEIAGRTQCLAIDAPVISRSGEAVAAVCRREHSVAVLARDAAGPEFRAVADLGFSPAGNHLAYLGAESAIEGLGPEACSQWRVVRDGEAGPLRTRVVEGSLTWSPDGSRLAYLASTDDGRWCCVNNDTAGPAFDEVLSPIVFAPKGGRMAYPVRQKGRWYMAGSSDAYDAVSDAVFGADSETLACRALSGGQWRVALGGLRVPEYDEILAGPIRQPNGAFEFLALRDKRLFRTHYIPR